LIAASDEKQAKMAVPSPPYMGTKKETAHDVREPPLAIQLAFRLLFI